MCFSFIIQVRLKGQLIVDDGQGGLKSSELRKKGRSTVLFDCNHKELRTLSHHSWYLGTLQYPALRPSVTLYRVELLP